MPRDATKPPALIVLPGVRVEAMTAEALWAEMVRHGMEIIRLQLEITRRAWAGAQALSGTPADPDARRTDR